MFSLVRTLKTNHNQIYNSMRLAGLVLAGSMAAGHSAISSAQDKTVADSEQEVETIVVRGIKKSLNMARDLKQDNAQFVDAIVSDDIGKMPDTTVAESLGRISGVQIDRGIGQGSDISIRGLRQNVILYNGRQIWDSAGRGSNGPDQLGTSTYGLLGTVPAALISQLQVEKLSASDQIDGALGGVVNIVSRKPFDENGEHIAGSFSYSDAELGGGSNEFFGMYSNTYADDRLGFLVSFVRSDSTNNEHALGTFSGYSLADNEGLADRTYDNNGNLVSTDPNGDGVSALIHVDPRPWQIEEDRERTGVNVVMQYLPTNNLEFTLDHYFTQLESDRDRRWLGLYAGFGDYNNVVFSENEVIVAGTVTRPTHTNVEFADIKSKVQSTALQAEWDATDDLQVFAELSYTKGEGTYDQQYMRLQTLANDNVNFDLTNGDFGQFQFQNDFTDASTLNFPITFFQEFVDETKDTTGRVDFDWNIDFGAFHTLEFGMRHQDLTTTKSHLNVDIRNISGVNTASDLLDAGLLEVFTNDDFLPGEFVGVPRSYLTFKESAMNGGGIAGCETLAQFYSAEESQSCADGTSGSAALNSFRIEEQFTAAYIKANFATDWANLPVSGNFGLRMLNRDLASIGNQQVGDNIEAVTFPRSDTEVLPSLALRMELDDGLIARFGAAQVISFPDTTSLNNGVRLFVDNDSDIGTGTGGSPNLDPFKATQLDMSLEWYFNADSLLSGALFYKDIDTFIVAETQLETIGGNQYRVLRDTNGEGAKVKGLEISYQQSLSFLPGVGTILTYSFIDGETPIKDDSGRTLSFPGLSENNINAVVYYENEDFNMRMAYNWRDEYLNSIGAGNTGVFNDDYKDLSFTARYNISEEVTLGFEASNLLNSQLRTYNAVPEALRTNAVFGKSYKLSISASF
ncbi:TonB-dependent receptor [Paraglaciecola sp. L3A3]|uniref:TonB-dependent receptor n=1 Tax=Paraglaciecola sp. L3A3 TaxID=2686358 RepID=UPI00131C15CB|nr:TonB-dependent receptor [Paraglaciecola sp. L3A3]